MLSDKQYLLLCELADLGKSRLQPGTICQAVQALMETEDYRENAVLREIAGDHSLNQIRLCSIDMFQAVSVYEFENACDQVFVLCAQNDYEDFDQLLDNIKSKAKTDCCSITGYALGGLYASHIAASLNMKGIVFRMPEAEFLGGDVYNYIAQDDPVGEHTQNIVFVKNKPLDDKVEMPFSQILMFDENGKAIEGTQSEYSKFISWFYNTAGNIKKEVWALFFQETSESKTLYDTDLYSIYLRINELSYQSIENSLKKTIIYLENELEKNRKIVACRFDGAEEAASKAAGIVKDIYGSVETILMGMAVFTMEKGCSGLDMLMSQFCEDVDAALQKEIHLITAFLKDKRSQCLEDLSFFPEIDIY